MAPPRWLVAPDAFKGTLSACQAARAIASGLRRAQPNAQVRCLPLADGGEGTVAVLRRALGGRWVRSRACDPLGRHVRARFALLGDGRIAAVEVAEASGLTRLVLGERDPLAAGSAGTGQLVRRALECGVAELWLCLGGSATVDGGWGLAWALGARGFDAAGRPVAPTGRGMQALARLELAGFDARLRGVIVRALCDVDSPLLGAAGARLFMAQKGATPEVAKALERGLARWAALLSRVSGCEVAGLTGAGAAGGLGAGLAALLGAKLESGADFVLDRVGFDAELAQADAVFTGEGRVDVQTARGKVVAAVARRARAAGVPAFALCGRAEGPLEALGLTEVAAIVPGLADEAAALARPAFWLRRLAAQVGRRA